MPRGRSWLRASAALAVGALALHEARYAIAHGDPAAPSAAGIHGYLALVAPTVALLVAVAAGRFLAELAAASPGARVERRDSSVVRLWLAVSAALLATHGGQEAVEGLLATGNLAGAWSLLVGGGWWVLALALSIGLALALAIRVADRAIDRASRRRPAPSQRRRGAPPKGLPRADLPSFDVLARNLAGRAPPPATV